MKEQENGRHEAAIQKYHQWKAEHPILQNVNANKLYLMSLLVTPYACFVSTLNYFHIVEEKQMSGINEEMLDRTNERKTTTERKGKRTDAETRRRKRKTA